MKVVPLRLRPGDDLRLALEAWMGQQHEQAGCLISGIGSLSVARLRLASRQQSTTLDGELEILSLAGTLSADGAHLHIAVADSTGKVIGGHLCAGSLVRTTAELVVGLLPEWRFSRELDPATGWVELEVRPLPARTRRTALQVVVGVAAITAPVLHGLSDAIEWVQGGFSPDQLWLSYLAFLVFSWLLLGISVLHGNRLGAAGLLGALLYGTAFTYFAHTALDALAARTPTYAVLWERLGPAYTFHGALMVLGGLLFSWSALRAGRLPGTAIRLFAAGLAVNLILALLSAPEQLQTMGTAIRNLGLIWMGIAILGSEHPGQP
jgi:uncharacterized protein